MIRHASKLILLGAAAAGFVLGDVATAEALPTGFSITCKHTDAGSACDTSGWLKDWRGRQEYEGTDAVTGKNCKSKVWWRIGRYTGSDGLDRNYVKIQFWKGGTASGGNTAWENGSWNTNRRIVITDIDRPDETYADEDVPGSVDNIYYDLTWDARPAESTGVPMALAHTCDDTAVKRIKKGLEETFGLVPPQGGWEWTPPDSVGEWKLFAAEQMKALNQVDLDVNIRAYNGSGGLCYPEAEFDPNRDDGYRCTVTMEPPQIVTIDGSSDPLKPTVHFTMIQDCTQVQVRDEATGITHLNIYTSQTSFTAPFGQVAPAGNASYVTWCRYTAGTDTNGNLIHRWTEWSDATEYDSSSP